MSMWIVLKMNSLKCAFGVSAGKFLDFIIHEHVIEIDPKKVESIKKVKAPMCKKDLQSLLSKVNYLRRFISNLSGKVNVFTPILHLKNGAEFIWGAEQQAMFEEIIEYLSTPPILKALQKEVPFRLYIAADNDVIGAVLTQETKGLLDMEIRYQFIEKLCFCFIMHALS
jgi:hypothetical protein